MSSMRPAGCADSTRSDGSAFIYDRLQLCGDVLSENPPPAQTLIAFLWTGSRRQPRYSRNLPRPDHTIREKPPWS